MTVFPICYAGNIDYFKSLLAHQEIHFEQYEHFPKQTFRNRLEILGPNGLQKLVIPTVKTGERRFMHSVEISYAENWQKDHWKSLEAAYRRSPYFEFYEDRFRPYYKEWKEPSLLNFNLKLLSELLAALSLDLEFGLTSSYQTSYDRDYRGEDFRRSLPEESYLQVFSDRHPFHPNLSMFDALFNLGPQAANLLR